MVRWRRRQPEPQTRGLLGRELHGSYQLTKELQIYGFINNLFNRKFATFGTFFDPQSTVANAIPNVLFDHRTVTPAQPLSVYVGMRAKL